MFGAHIAATIVLAQAAPAAAPVVSPQAAPPAEAAAPSSSSTISPLVVTGRKPISKRREVDLNEITCHDELPPGTRFKIKVCATNRQFAERTREQQEMVRDWQNTPKSTQAQ